MLSRLRAIRGNEGFIAVAITLVAALVVDQVTTFGRTVDTDFYAAVAQVIPILLLALIVETTAPFAGFHTTVFEAEREVEEAVAEAQESRDDIEQMKARLAEIPEPSEELRAAAENFIQACEAVIKIGEERPTIAASFAPIGRAVQGFLLGHLAVAAVGEAAALCALAAGTSTTFLFVTTALSLAAMVVLFARTLLVRFKPPEALAGTRERPAPPRSRPPRQG